MSNNFCHVWRGKVEKRCPASSHQSLSCFADFPFIWICPSHDRNVSLLLLHCCLLNTSLLQKRSGMISGKQEMKNNPSSSTTTTTTTTIWLLRKCQKSGNFDEFETYFWENFQNLFKRMLSHFIGLSRHMFIRANTYEIKSSKNRSFSW